MGLKAFSGSLRKLESQYSLSRITNREQLLLIHSHKNLFEVLLCVQGSAVHLINDKKEKIGKGSLVFIRCDDVHGHMEPISNDYQIFSMVFSSKTAEDAFAYLGDEIVYKKLLAPELSPAVIIPKLEYPKVKNTMERFFFQPVQDQRNNQLRLRIFLMDILINYFVMPDMEKNNDTPSWIEWIINEMNRPKNFIGGVKALHDIACRSPEHVCREFKKYLKKTPTDVVNQIRLKEASRLLIYTDDKIINICEKVGFTNQSHFNHLFKAYYSVSPLEYRKKYLNSAD